MNACTLEVADLSRTTWYVAGPMSGVPQHNIPMFDRVTDALRNFGYTVISPAELDEPEVREEALADPTGSVNNISGMTWGDFLARDVKLVSDEATGIALLPGWQQSRGARLEAFIGLLCDHRFAEVDTFQDELVLSPVSAQYVKREIFNAA